LQPAIPRARARAVADAKARVVEPISRIFIGPCLISICAGHDCCWDHSNSTNGG
jgi:hypothetical protein